VGAHFGAYFSNVANEKGESYALYTLSGAPQEAFAQFPMPGNTDVFAPTFRGEGIVRSDDITQDPRYGRHAPSHGMPAGHLPVRSYLAAPVVSRSGVVLGGLFFGHAEVGAFTERHEHLLAGIAAQAAVAHDNAHLYRQAEQARLEAETANRLKDEFLATVSHELRTPLSAILGYAQVLQRGEPTPEQMRRGLATIERNVKIQAQLINDLLDVSRIISGKLRLDVQPVDLAAVIHAAIDTVLPAAEAKGIRIQRILDPLAAPVSGDPGRLQQVVWNLLSNAIKFTPRDGRVQVVLERVNSHLEITVSDTGIGITPEFLPHVFERFRQVDSATTRRHGGLGLGLAIVRHLVELHGGTVRAKSAGESQGTSFTVMLPLPILRDEAVSPSRVHPLGEFSHRPAEVEAPLECPPSLKGLRVLVVDDEPDTVELMRHILEECEAEVRMATSAKAALLAFEQFLPDVLVSDIGMPEEDGYDLIRQIRALPAENGGIVPAVAITAFARAEDRRRALLSGFQAHLAKPMERDDLITLVASLAQRTGPRP
jgi:signal transduction histidine kinase/CheY-like chemotaxis protein